MTHVDLRSDTLTRPSGAMRRAMASADVGDDVYGEDPEVNALQEEVADRFGREAALLVSSGVQGNLLGMHVFARPGTEVVVEQDAHLVAFEVGASAMFAGVQFRTVTGDRGRLTPVIARTSLRPTSFPFTEVSAVAMEETTNLAGGAFQGAAGVAGVRDVARDRGLNTWLDGARLFNAIVAGGGSAREYGAAVDGLTFCVSKGLGAPVGSVMVGDRAAMDEAVKWRRRHGGAMRQSGVLAAAARYALANNVDRLADDHANAHRLAVGLADRRPGAVNPDDVDTNIVYVDTGERPAAAIQAACKTEGVIFGTMGESLIRL
ncbi:MAG: threonine aldolase, partial [Glaciecola sp.]